MINYRARNRRLYTLRSCPRAIWCCGVAQELPSHRWRRRRSLVICDTVANNNSCHYRADSGGRETCTAAVDDISRSNSGALSRWRWCGGAAQRYCDAACAARQTTAAAAAAIETRRLPVERRHDDNDDGDFGSGTATTVTR